MNTSEKLDKLAPALAKAQSEMSGAVKGTANDFFRSKYADLGSVWEACKEPLHNNGFSVVQSPIDRDGRIGVVTLLLHESGQFIQDEFTLGVKKQNDPQADGSSISYARRYALSAFAGIVQVDDDGERAMHRKDKQEKTEPTEREVALDELVYMLNQFENHDECKDWMSKPQTASYIKEKLGEDSPELKQFRQRCSQYLKSLKEKP